MDIDLTKFKELGFESTEELMVSLYFQELQEAGFIKEIISQPESFILYKGLSKKFFKFKQLKTKIKKAYSKKQYLINPRAYTADFKIIWDINYVSILEGEVKSKFIQSTTRIEDEFNVDIPFYMSTKCDNYKVSYLEVKSSWDMSNMTRLFTSRTQPWVYEKFGIYVQLIKPYDLFKSTFIPKSILPFMYYRKATKKNKVGDKKYNWEYRTLTEYLNL